MTAPFRLQLSRAKGFNLQHFSVETNGLPAVNVARPSVWGNPFKLPRAHTTAYAFKIVERYRGAWCGGPIGDRVVLEQWFKGHRWQGGLEPGLVRSYLGKKNLACWCSPGQPCHADVLLEIANR